MKASFKGHHPRIKSRIAMLLINPCRRLRTLRTLWAWSLIMVRICNRRWMIKRRFCLRFNSIPSLDCLQKMPAYPSLRICGQTWRGNGSHNHPVAHPCQFQALATAWGGIYLLLSPNSWTLQASPGYGHTSIRWAPPSFEPTNGLWRNPNMRSPTPTLPSRIT